MIYRLKALLLLVIVVISYRANAQPNYKKGYVITLSNDTLFGVINDRGYLRNYRLCVFKTNKKSKSTKFRPSDIKAYRFNGGKYYSAQQINNDDSTEYVFLDVLLESKINLYYNLRNKEVSYYIKRDTGSLIGLEKIEFYKPRPLVYGATSYKYTGIQINFYKDTLYSLFSDCKKIQQHANNVDYNKKALINITKAYVNETCKSAPCISYEYDLRSSKVHFGVFSGFQFSRINFLKNNLKSNTSTSNPIGLFINFPLNIYVDRLIFQIECISNSLDYKKESFNNTKYPGQIIQIKSKTIGFPVLIKYKISERKVSPTIAFGKETAFVYNSSVTYYYNSEIILHHTQKRGWFGEVGLQYNITKKLSFFSNVRFQSTYNLLISPEFERAKYSDVVKTEQQIAQYKTNIISQQLGIIL
jgi:hypothetical protein